MKGNNIISSEQVIICDIDGTVLMWGKVPIENKTVNFLDPYSNQVKTVAYHPPHVKILHDRLTRGATIIFASASGYQWAVNAVDAIKHLLPANIADKVFFMSKPVGYIDDKHCEKWMGDWINMDFNDPYRD